MINQFADKAWGTRRSWRTISKCSRHWFSGRIWLISPWWRHIFLYRTYKTSAVNPSLLIWNKRNTIHILLKKPRMQNTLQNTDTLQSQKMHWRIFCLLTLNLLYILWDKPLNLYFPITLLELKINNIRSR